MNLSIHTCRLAAVAALVIASPTASAAFFVTVDTATELSGNFQVFGFSSAYYVPSEFMSLPSTVRHLPYGDFLVTGYLNATRDFGYSQFDTRISGTPDDPNVHRFSFDGQGPFIVSGRYTDGGPSQDTAVDWRIQYINHNPSQNDVMEGSFSFTVAAVPEPAETAAVIGAGLVAFAVVCRNRRRAFRTDV